MTCELYADWLLKKSMLRYIKYNLLQNSPSFLLSDECSSLLLRVQLITHLSQ